MVSVEWSIPCRGQRLMSRWLSPLMPSGHCGSSLSLSLFLSAPCGIVSELPPREVAPLGHATWALVGPSGVGWKTLFLHLGWSSRTGEDGSELRAGTEGRDMFTLVQSFINCLPKGRRAVAWARLRRLQWHPYIYIYSDILLCT